MLTALTVVMAACVLQPLSSVADDSGWQPVKSTASIDVQQKTIASSPFKATRGSMVSNARMFDVLAVLKDVKACPQWLHKCKFGEVIAEISEAERIYYTVIDSPFLLKDRDTYVRSEVTYSKEHEALHIKMNGVEDTAPPARKRVRVLDFQGRWQIERFNDEQIRLIYEIHMNPQVSTAGAVNSTMATSVLETLRNVDRMARSRPYLNSAIPDAVKLLKAPAATH